MNLFVQEMIFTLCTLKWRLAVARFCTTTDRGEGRWLWEMPKPSASWKLPLCPPPPLPPPPPTPPPKNNPWFPDKNKTGQTYSWFCLTYSALWHHFGKIVSFCCCFLCHEHAAAVWNYSPQPTNLHHHHHHHFLALFACYCVFWLSHYFWLKSARGNLSDALNNVHVWWSGWMIST